MRPPTTRAAMERREASGPSQGPARPGTPTALKRLGSRKLGAQAGRSQGWPDGASHAPWRLPALHRGTRCRRPHPAPSSAVAIDDALERARQSRWYRGGKRTEGLFELRCEFSGESANAGIAQPDQSPSCHHRAAPKARAPIALPPTKIFLREAGCPAFAGHDDLGGSTIEHPNSARHRPRRRAIQRRADQRAGARRLRLGAHAPETALHFRRSSAAARGRPPQLPEAMREAKRC